MNDIKPSREIRAVYDDKTITVYQAYNKEIAEKAVEAQTFVPPFKMDRMTWIKPSFLWMMYRSGWGQKPGQEHILAIKILREGFEWALEHSCLSHFEKDVYSSKEEWLAVKEKSPVIIQWDPERDINLNPLTYRSIQIGLSGIAVKKFVDEWIVCIKDIDKKILNIHSIPDLSSKHSSIPTESNYPLQQSILEKIGALP